MIALIDADLVAFRSAASAENDTEEIAIARTSTLMKQLLEETNASSYRAFLTGQLNFRKEIDDQYKANRADKPNPQWLQNCREFLVREWKAEVQDGVEADDALAIAQTADTVIVSLDKDLLQVEGRHYQWRIEGGPIDKRWVKEACWYNISYIDGLRSFYTSCLVGDKSDNIIGVDGIGKTKAPRILAGCETEQEMFDICRELYKDDQRYFKNLKLLWLMKKENDVFNPKERGLINE